MIFESVGSPVRGQDTALERLPDMEVAPRLMVVALSKCARSSSIESSGFVFAFHGSVSLPHHLWSICDISGAFNSPDSASTRPCGLVGPPGVTDISSIEIARTSIAQGQEGSAFLVETY